jgi:hypothetical protein
VAADSDRAAATAPASDRAGATAIDDHPLTEDRSGADGRGTSPPPKPLRAIRERLTDGGDPDVARDEHARAADEHTRAADEHARAAEEETRPR